MQKSLVVHSEGRVTISVPAEEGLPNQQRCLYTSHLSPFTRSTSGLVKSWYKWGFGRHKPTQGSICLLSLQVIDWVLLDKTTRHQATKIGPDPREGGWLDRGSHFLPCPRHPLSLEQALITLMVRAQDSAQCQRRSPVQSSGCLCEAGTDLQTAGIEGKVRAVLG